MATKSVVLATNVSAVADTASVEWTGGRGSLVVLGGTFPTTCQLQYMGQDNSTWINFGSNLTASGFTAADYPAGLYRVHMTGGTAANIYINLVSVPYC